MFRYCGVSFPPNDPYKERKAPPLPTPPTFPAYDFAVTHSPFSWSQTSKPSLHERFSSLRKPQYITAEHFTALNISLKQNVPLESLLPNSPDGSSYLPPSSWLDQSSPSHEHSSAAANNGGVTDREAFITRLQELLVDNDDAFRVLSRLPVPEGRTAPRLAHFRRFFEGLDSLSQYWDASLDHYFIPPSASRSEQDVFTPATLKSVNTDMSTDSVETTGPQDRASQSSPAAKRVKPSPPSPQESMSAASYPAKPRYTGRRTSTGWLAPPEHLSEAARACIEPIAWAFKLQIQAPRRQPQLCIGNLRMPVRLDAGLYVTPSERERARRGEVIGPVMGLQSRPYVDFRGKGEDDLDNETDSAWCDETMEWEMEAEYIDPPHRKEAARRSALDLLRETSTLLLLAQERAREGRSEVQSGKEKWWTTAARWGGGPGGEVGTAEGSGTDTLISAADIASKSAGTEGRGNTEREKGRRGLRKGNTTAAEAWRVLKPGPALWDPKTTYQAIGKEEGSDWDDVFLVSALNHHISILRLRIHIAYIDYLTTGTFPNVAAEYAAWCLPTLYRTKWYDLFDVGQRAEVMRGVWGVLAYLMRARGH